MGTLQCLLIATRVQSLVTQSICCLNGFSFTSSDISSVASNRKV